jgi:tetratricopeptide (TPR) repeat protein
MKKITFQFARAIAVGAIVFSLSLVSFGQNRGGQSGPPAGGGQQGGGGRQPGNQPTIGNQPTQQSTPEMPRQIYLSGNVRLSDGTIPPTNVVIERVCGGVVRPEAYTDSKGNFSFIVGGQNSAIFADASVAGPNTGVPGQQNGIDGRSLTGCEIRANLPGFLSDSIILGFRGPLDDPEIGMIHLHRLANVEGYTFSITTGLAPKDARKAYEKGLDDIKKRKWADAEKELSKSVELYPKFAVAWYELGRAYQQEKKFDEANHAQLEAVKIDSKFISPYGELATMAATQQKWDDLDQYTAQMLKLNPYVVPEIYFYSAVANFNLHKMDLAERRAREAAKSDTQHKVPRINHLLGLILAQKQEYKEAAENMRIYLKYSPNAKDADNVKQQVDEMEKALAQNQEKN